MKSKVITDNTVETITVKWDGERFAIVKQFKCSSAFPRITLLNPKEMLDLIEFAGKVWEKV